MRKPSMATTGEKAPANDCEKRSSRNNADLRLAPPLASVQMTDYVFCDICTSRVDTYYRCTICQFGQFDICKPCFGRGHWCPTEQHQLIEVEARVEIGRRDPTTYPVVQERPESRHFSYSSLVTPQSSDTFIRLLTVYPNQPGEDPTADIRSWPFLEAPEYEALSYCWGPIQPISFMRLNGKRLPITPNLHKALGQIAASRNESFTLWVDAICINQSDSTEKSKQVSMMRDIYERASRTVVWLGTATGKTQLALTMCLRMLDLHGYTFFAEAIGDKHYAVFNRMLGQTSETAAIIERRRQLFVRNLIKLWSDHGSNLTSQELETAAKNALDADISPQASRIGVEDWVGSFTDHVYVTPSTPTSQQIPPQSRTSRLRKILAQQSSQDPKKPQLAEIIATRDLFSSPWFNRMWVVQETIMAREVVFNYGMYSVPGWIIHAGLRIARDFVPALKFSLLNFTTVWAFRRALCRHPHHSHEEHKGRGDLRSLLMTFRTRDATDPRDKVYALLGITSDDSEKLGITVRYDRSVAATYTEAAIAILKSKGDLSILELLKPVTGHTPDLPSWVPDWADKSLPLAPLAETLRLKPSDKDEQVNPFNIITAEPASCLFKATMDGRLTLSGHICDVITDVGTAMPTFDEEADILDKGFQPCRPGIMHEKFVLTQRMYSRVRDRFKIYEAWERMARAKALYPTGEDPTFAYKCTLQAGPDKPPHVTMQEFQTWYENLGTYYEVLDKITAYDIDSLKRFSNRHEAIEMIAGGQEFSKLPKPPQFDCSYGRKLVRTAKDYLGLAPIRAEVGDSVVLAKGAGTPLIARKTGTEWIMIGPAYVHGIMHGETWDETRCLELIVV
jgi:hypothetical protein